MTQKVFLEDLPDTRPLVGVLDQHVLDQFFQVARIVVRDLRVRASKNLQNQTFHRVGVKSMSQGHHLIENASHTPDVTFLVVRHFLTDLRRQVIWGSYRGLGTIISVLKNSSDSKVTNLDLSRICHENILSFQISVQNPPVVNMLNRESHLNEPV